MCLISMSVVATSPSPSKHCNNNRLFLNPAEDLPLVSLHQAGHTFMALLPQLYKIIDQKVQEMSHTYIRPQYECNIRFFLHLVPLFLQPRACRSAKISTHTAHNKGFGVREKTRTTVSIPDGWQVRKGVTMLQCYVTSQKPVYVHDTSQSLYPALPYSSCASLTTPTTPMCTLSPCGASTNLVMSVNTSKQMGESVGLEFVLCAPTKGGLMCSLFGKMEDL